MKKWMSILLAAMLLLGTLASAETLPVQTNTLTVEEKVTQMYPMLDSLVRCLGVQGDTAYTVMDRQLLWNLLYVEGANWSEDALTKAGTQQKISVPGTTILNWAAAVFPGIIALPAIPTTMTVITYDATSDTYVLEPYNKASMTTTVERYAVRADGTVCVVVGLYNAMGVRIGALTVELAEAAQPTAAQALPYQLAGVVAGDPIDTTLLWQMVNITSDQWILTTFPQTVTLPMTTPVAQRTQAPTPAPVVLLRFGSKGEEVRRVQQRLSDLGYPVGKPDGDFGSNTEKAVRYFQGDVGIKEDGIVGDTVRARLFANSAPEYVKYVSLSRGDSGIRVENLQSRLRDLGYLAEPMDGIYGSRTSNAVALFQEEAGLRANGAASVTTLRELMSSDAPECSIYIELRSGDTGKRVAEMQAELVRLGYLEKVSKRYDKATVEAVKAFALSMGEEINGKTASQDLIASMAMAVAPTATPTPTVTPTPTPTVTDEPTATPEPTSEPTKEPLPTFTADQVTKMAGYVRTELGKDDMTDEDAVKWLQAKLGMAEEDQTGKYDEKTVEAVMKWQKDHYVDVTGAILWSHVHEMNKPAAPTAEPTAEPTEAPTPEPTEAPTPEPTQEPTPEPTEAPTPEPTETPTPEPTAVPLPTFTKEEITKMAGFIRTELEQPDWTDEDAIKWLQTTLKMDQIDQTGKYDEKTIQAVMDWQKEHYVEVTGAITWSEVHEMNKNNKD